MLKDVFQKHNIEYFAVLPYAVAKPFLKNVRAVSRIPENAKSIVVALFPYLVDEQEDANISAYAVVEDYHKVVPDILEDIGREIQEKRGGSFAVFTDNSPFPEVALAALGKLGKIGDNSLLINDKYGSYTFIGEIVFDIEFPEEQRIELSHIGANLISSIDEKHRETLFLSDCKTCSNCKKACPGGVCGKAERDNCASFVSQKKGELSESEKELIKRSGLVWGCDICQTVCPKNKNAAKTPIERFRENTVFSVSESTADTLSKERAFGFRGSAVIKRNISVLSENKKKGEPEK